MFHSAWRQSRGARSYQEDTAVVWPGQVAEAADGGSQLLAVLADGMGGHTGGAIASRTVCDGFLKAYSGGNGPLPRRLVTALEASNDAVAREVASDPSLYGMGSTLVGATFGLDGVEWVSVGDSPLFLYRHGEIALLNEDHSLAPALDQLVAQGKLSAERARNDPRRHMLRSAITGEEVEMVDVSRRPLPLESGDFVILASDGIHTLEPAEIARVVAAYGADGCDVLASALIRAVEQMRAPHQDNTTVIVVQPNGELPARGG